MREENPLRANSRTATDAFIACQLAFKINATLNATEKLAQGSALRHNYPSQNYPSLSHWEHGFR